MPKKNAFFLFMNKRKAELQAEGVVFPGGLAQVAEMVDKEWQELPESEKQAYKDRAAFLQAQKPKTEVFIPEPAQASTSAAAVNPFVPDSEWTMKMGKLIGELVDKYPGAEMPITLVNFSCYELSPVLLPAEMAMCTFNIRQGLIDNFASLIDPRGEPKAPRKLSLPLPGYNNRLQDVRILLNSFHAYVSQYSRSFYGTSYLWCLDRDAGHVTSCMDWLFLHAGQSFPYKLLSLDMFIHQISYKAYMNRLADFMATEIGNVQLTPKPSEDDHDMDLEDSEAPANPAVTRKQVQMVEALKKKHDVSGAFIQKPKGYPFMSKGIFFQPQEVAVFLEPDNLSYIEEIACMYHMVRGDGVQYCPMNVVNRVAYCLLDVLVDSFYVIPIPGQHYPRLDAPHLEGLRRRKMLQPWAHVDYVLLAYSERAKDPDFPDGETPPRRGQQNIPNAPNLPPRKPYKYLGPKPKK